MSRQLSVLLLVGTFLFLGLALSSPLLADTLSDEIIYTPQNGAHTITGKFDNLDQKIPETANEGALTSQLLLTWNPANGVVLPKTFVLTEPGNPNYISDIFKLTVNNDASVLTFVFVSDGETSLVPPMTVTASIPENGSAAHPLDQNGFLNLTRDLFSAFAVGAEPATVLVKSDSDVTVTPEPPSGGLCGLSVLGLLGFMGMRRAIERR